MAEKFLNYESIDDAIFEIEAYLKKNQVKREDIIRITFSAEEILMKYYRQFGESIPFTLSFTKRFGKRQIIFALKCDSFDPQNDISEDDRFYNSVLQNLNLAPTWQYKKGENRIVFTLNQSKKISPLAWNIIAIALAVILGLFFKSYGSLTTVNSFCETFLDPVNSAIMSWLSATAIFFVFFSIISGICNMGDISTFNKIGKKIFIRLLLTMLIITAFLAVLSLLAFPLSSEGQTSMDYGELWKTVIGIIPVNFVESFATGNNLQVAFLAVCFGIILLILGEKGRAVSEFADHANNLNLMLMQWVITLMPISIFVSIFKLMVNSHFEEMVQFYKYPLYVLIIGILISVFFLLRTVITQHVSVKVLFKKLFPILLIAFSTASSAATISLSYEVCEKKLGIDKQIIHIGWPLSNTILSTVLLICCYVGCLVSAQIYKVPISLPALITFSINILILAIATPNFPGVMITGYTILLGSLGVPIGAMAMLVPLDFIIDRIGTTFSSIVLHTELIQEAAGADMLNRDILRSDI